MDEYLNWHHTGIRQGAAQYIFRKYFLPNMMGRFSSEESLNDCLMMLHMSLKTIVRIWLSKNRKTKFMFGDTPSIADITLACELASLEGINFMPEMKEKYPTIHEWLYTHMMSYPEYKEIHDQGTKVMCRSIPILEKKLAKLKAKMEAEAKM